MLYVQLMSSWNKGSFYLLVHFYNRKEDESIWFLSVLGRTKSCCLDRCISNDCHGGWLRDGFGSGNYSERRIDQGLGRCLWRIATKHIWVRNKRCKPSLFVYLMFRNPTLSKPKILNLTIQLVNNLGDAEKSIPYFFSSWECSWPSGELNSSFC